MPRTRHVIGVLLSSIALCNAEHIAHRSFIPLDSNGVFTIETSGSWQVLCHDGESNLHLITEPYKAWAPLEIVITPSPECALTVRTAEEDSIHRSVSKYLARKLGVEEMPGGGEGEETDISDEVTMGVGAGVIGMFLACPHPWASDKIACVMRVSPFGRSCMAVKPLKKMGLIGGGGPITIQTATNFQPNLVVRFVVGLTLIMMAHQLSKSKIFQYTAGASLGIVFSVLLLFALGFRRQDSRRWFYLAGGAVVSCTGAFLTTLKSEASRLLVSKWEIVLTYASISALCGILVTRKIRSDPDVKHRARVTAKWFFRLLGLWMVRSSTPSGAAGGALGIAFVIWYIIFETNKRRRLQGVPVMTGTVNVNGKKHA